MNQFIVHKMRGKRGLFIKILIAICQEKLHVHLLCANNQHSLISFNDLFTAVAVV